MKRLLLLTISFHLIVCGYAQRPRELGIEIGIFRTGVTNTITDVPGVRVGHSTLIKGRNIRTGVTAILPHSDTIFQNKIPAAIYIGNGYGKLAGYSQVEELGTIETPIILTNTLSVATAIDAVITHTLQQDQSSSIRSVNAVVGETNDGFLNDIQGRHVKEKHVLEAISSASSDQVIEGNVGAGTGTRAFGYKGGIGSASRELPAELGGYTIGVLVQTNFGGVLEIAGVPIAKELGNIPYKEAIESVDGSCMIVVLTNAPVSERNLKRMGKRAIMGLAKTGGVASNGSGDYVIVGSTAEENRIPHTPKGMYEPSYLPNDEMTPLFIATIEATEEAIVNSLFAAEDMTGANGNALALPKEKVLEIMKNYGRLLNQ